MRSRQILLNVALFLLAFCGVFGGKKEEKKKLPLSYLKYIACDVCKKAVEGVNYQIMAFSILQEASIDRLFDRVCEAHEQSWLRKQDIVSELQEDGTKLLKFVEAAPGIVQKCGEECVLIREGCMRFVTETLDRDRAVGLIRQTWLTRSWEVDTVTQQQICGDWEKQCPQKVFMPNSTVHIDYPFVPMAEVDVIGEYEARRIKMEKAATTTGVTASFDIAEDMAGVRAKLYFNDKYVGRLSQSPVKHTTFLGHNWVVKINDKVVKTYAIGLEPEQHYTLTWKDVEVKDL